MTDIAQRIAALSPEQRAALQQRLKKRQQTSALLPRQDRSQVMPLSYAQERLWLHYQHDPESSVYNLPVAVRLRGTLDPVLLEQVFNELVARHESLRTVFFEQDGRPVQQVLPECPLTVVVHRLEHVPADVREAEVQRLIDADARRPFDLARGPLLRATLILLPGECVLISNMHHIASDDWSAGILVREKLALYAAREQGQPLTLPELPVQYIDFAAWQRERLNGASLDQQLAYWEQQLAGPLPVIELPLDRPRPPVQTSNGGRVTRRLSGSLLAELKQLGRTEGATLFMTSLSAFVALLHRYSSQEDILIGTPITSRNRAELEGVLGCFINMLVLRLDVSGDCTFRELLGRVRATALEAYASPDVPFEQLLDVLRPPRDASRSPLFQVGFQVQDPMELRKYLPDTVLAYQEVDDGTTQFDLALQVAEDGNALQLAMLFNSDLFDAETATRMLAHLEVLLKAAIADPDCSVMRLPLLPDAELSLLARWNETAVAYPPDACVHHMVARQAALTPDATALECEHQRLSYRELDARANQLAHLLRAQGVGAETLVGLSVTRSLDLVIGMLAIHKAGGAYVPLDPDYPAERMAFMLQDAGIGLVLTQQELLERLPVFAGQALCLDTDATQIAQYPTLPPEDISRPDHLAYLIYTSGTTGTPKAVMVEHGSLANVLLASRDTFAFAASDRIPCLAPYSFDIFQFELWNPLIVGGCAVLLTGDHVLDMARLTADLPALTAIHAVPSLMQQIINWIDDHDMDVRQFDRVTRVFTGGDAVPPALLTALQRVFRRAQVYVLYGPTEATIICSRYALTPGERPSRRLIGRPLPNSLFRICDRAGTMVPIGVPGELLIGGRGVARGYAGRDQLTAEKFVTADGSRWYRSGDLVRNLPDGTLEFLGRIDSQVKIRGNRVELGEIETIARHHPSVREAVVVAHTDPQGEKRLVAYVVPETEQPELWPSIGEYFVYDELIYYGLTNDTLRNDRYTAAMERLVRDRVVVDIGTGRDAIQARLCVAAGARHVYAIEILEESYRHARRQVKELGLDDRITVIHGNAMEISLPEPVDVCVSEIVEAIGGAEGAAPILNAARRLIKPDGAFIPSRSLTKIAAVSLPDALVETPRFGKVAGTYLEKIFAQVGHPLDVRLCIKNFPKGNLISDVQIFEDLDFSSVSGSAAEEYRHTVSFQIERDGRMDGFLLWLNLQLDASTELDILDEPCSWFPVYFPIFYPGLPVSAGDRIDAVCEATLSENGINPDYHVRGQVVRANGEQIPFDYTSVHHQDQYRATPYYAHLFSGDALPVETEHRQAIGGKQVRAYLSERLPGYMVPSSVLLMDALPLTRNGKVDRAALPAPDQQHEQTETVAPRSALEETLARIWAHVLRRDQIGVYDNFFELGGDSILSLQIVSQASQAGIQFTSKQLFEHQTVAALAQVARQEATTAGEQGPVEGPVLLTPVQQRFFADALPTPSHFTQTMVLHMPATVDTTRLEQAIVHVLAHHDALRMRYHATADGWEQIGTLALPAAPLRVEHIATPDWDAAFTAHGAALQRQLNLQDGPLTAFALFTGHPDGNARLLIIVHHLLIDGVSWHTLLADLQTAYEQLVRGATVALPPKTTSFQAWARHLHVHARSEQVQQEAAFWLAQRLPASAELPFDLAGGISTYGNAATITAHLDAETTGRLLHETPVVYHARIDQILLAAAAHALSTWSNQPYLLIDMEGHGREEDTGRGIALTRTIGWFTSVYPLLLDAGTRATPEAVLRQVKAQVRAVPQGGIGYGLLRYTATGATADALAANPPAQIGFNYLGQFGQPNNQGALFTIGPDDPGPRYDEQGQRPHVLDIEALIVNGQLHLQWVYSTGHFFPDTIAMLSQRCLATLRALIERSEAPAEATYVPSDFPMAQLDAGKLATILKKMR